MDHFNNSIPKGGDEFSYMQYANTDLNSQRISYYFDNKDKIIDKTKTDKENIKEIQNNIFIYYFIISIELCKNNSNTETNTNTDNVKIILSDPNLYFYKTSTTKSEKYYMTIDEIQNKIKTEFTKNNEVDTDNTLIDYIVIEKYTEQKVGKPNPQEKRYTLMKTRDFENTFCYVEKIKTSLRSTDVKKIMSILMDSDTQDTKSFTDIQNTVVDNSMYQILQRIGLETYNTIADHVMNTPGFIINQSHEQTQEPNPNKPHELNKSLFEKTIITERFTKICLSDTNNYVSTLHNEIKRGVMTNKVESNIDINIMNEIYNNITGNFGNVVGEHNINDKLFNTQFKKALLITYIQLLIEKWIDLYITNQLNEELISNDKSTDHETKLLSYMIKQSNCKIHIIKYQLSLLYTLTHEQKLKDLENKNNGLPTQKTGNNLVYHIDRRITHIYEKKTHFKTLKAQLKDIIDNNSLKDKQLTEMNITLAKLLNNMGLPNNDKIVKIGKIWKALEQFITDTKQRTVNNPIAVFNTTITEILSRNTTTDSNGSAINNNNTDANNTSNNQPNNVNLFIIQVLSRLVSTVETSGHNKQKARLVATGNPRGEPVNSDKSPSLVSLHKILNSENSENPENLKKIKNRQEVMSKSIVGQLLNQTPAINTNSKNNAETPINNTKSIPPTTQVSQEDLNKNSITSIIKPMEDKFVKIQEKINKETELKKTEIEDKTKNILRRIKLSILGKDDDYKTDYNIMKHVIKRDPAKFLNISKEISDGIQEEINEIIKTTNNSLEIYKKNEQTETTKAIVQRINVVNESITNTIQTANSEIQKAIEDAINEINIAIEAAITKRHQKNNTKPKSTENTKGPKTILVDGVEDIKQTNNADTLSNTTGQKPTIQLSPEERIKNIIENAMIIFNSKIDKIKNEIIEEQNSKITKIKNGLTSHINTLLNEKKVKSKQEYNMLEKKYNSLRRVVVEDVFDKNKEISKETKLKITETINNESSRLLELYVDNPKNNVSNELKKYTKDLINTEITSVTQSINTNIENANETLQKAIQNADKKLQIDIENADKKLNPQNFSNLKNESISQSNIGKKTNNPQKQNNWFKDP